jgi:imidazolonepropionase-like amidohydrolase
MPGLIDAHVHFGFGSLLLTQLYDPKTTPETLQRRDDEFRQADVASWIHRCPRHGRSDLSLKRAIDAGKTPGPRIWPLRSCDLADLRSWRFPRANERSRRFFGKPSRAEEYGATFIADGRDEVLTATRENLRMGASQIKLMGGGGTSSAYDPIDVTQYTLDEMKAAVEASDDWNTYVAVHAYTPARCDAPSRQA